MHVSFTGVEGEAVVGNGAGHLPPGEICVQPALGAEHCPSYQRNRRKGGTQNMDRVLRGLPI